MPEPILHLFYLFLPWLVLLLTGLVFLKLFRWAKKKKTSAVIFGALVQMFMPDPYVDRTIKVVVEEKKVTKNDDGIGDQ